MNRGVLIGKTGSHNRQTNVVKHAAKEPGVMSVGQLLAQLGHHKTVLEEWLGSHVGVAAQLYTKKKIGRSGDRVVDSIHTHRLDCIVDGGKCLGLAAIGTNRHAVKSEPKHIWIGQGQPFKIAVLSARHSSQQIQK